MNNTGSGVYNDVAHAYSMVLEQLQNGKIDEKFFQYVNSVYSFAETSGEDLREEMAAEIYNIVSQQDSVGLIFSMFSFLIHLSPKELYLEDFLQKLRNLQKICYLEWQTAGYYYRQLNRIRLRIPKCDTENVRSLLSELVRRGVISCMRQMNVAVSPLPYKERNGDRAVVLTEEFLEDDSEHMQQVLECCYQLQHKLRKKVLLVNTAESASRVGEVSFFGPEYGIIDQELKGKSQIEWKGEVFEFVQCEDIFSEMKYIEEMVKIILEYNPVMAFHIGDSSFFAGIIDEWLPVMSIGGTYGRFAVTAAEFQVVFESIKELEQEFFEIAGEYERTIMDEVNLKVRLVFPVDYFQDENRRYPHYEEGTWDSYTISSYKKKIWAVELGMLKEFIRICQKYDIGYFAHKGTLLGAVKYQGFSYWDNDIDISMKREDYNKFKEVAPKEMEKRYSLMDASIVPQWGEFKIQIMCSSHVEEVFAGREENVLFFPSIDIAVLDYFPSDVEEAKSRKKKLQDIFEMMWRIDYNGKLAGHSILDFEEMKKSLGFSIDETAPVRNQLVQLQQLISGQEVKYTAGLYHSIDYYCGNRQSWRIFQEEWFTEMEKIPFENELICVPRLYSEVLEFLYGSVWHEERCAAISEEEDNLNLDKSLYNEEELIDFKKNFFQEEKKNIHFIGLKKVEYFFIEKKMKCAWAASIKVLKELEHICKKHGLLYFADWGTLLGAVRHQGYIPWDDDIDIAMKREDYNKFLEIAKEELPEGYCIVDEVYNENWTTNVSRIINVPSLDKGWIRPHTEREEEFFGSPYIIGVDIYQLDYIPWNQEEAELQMDLFANAIKLKYDLRENGNKVTKEIRERAKTLEEACHYKFKDDSTMLRQSLQLIGAMAQLYGPGDGDELGYIYTRFQSRRFRHREEWFEDSVALPFETTTVEVPKDYMKLILEECGKGWRVGYMGGTGHDYPFYKKQDRDLEGQGVIIP